MARDGIHDVLVIFVVSNATVNDCTHAHSTYLLEGKEKNGCTLSEPQSKCICVDIEKQGIGWCQPKIHEVYTVLLRK